MKKYVQLIGILIAGFILLQLVPIGKDHTNPPVVAEPKWDSPQTRALAKRACFDCHSNETVWPWYSNFAPVSWMVIQDVNIGRDVINFSEWPPTLTVSPGRVGGVGQEIANVVLEAEMPPVNYLPFHPEANLTSAERQQLAKGI